MLIYQVKEGTSKQVWLGSVTLCQRCGSQQPKGGFKVVEDEEVCAYCQKEMTAELLTFTLNRV